MLPADAGGRDGVQEKNEVKQATVEKAKKDSSVLNPKERTHTSVLKREEFPSASIGKPGLNFRGYQVIPSGWLRIDVKPVDAEVLVNGFPVVIDQTSGSSTSAGFPVGVHSVEVRRPGFQTYRSRVEVKQATEIVLRITLSQSNKN
jgi:hypothetical protein